MAVILPPVTLPAALTDPLVTKLAPVMLPAKLAVVPMMFTKLAVPAVAMLPPTMLPEILAVLATKSSMVISAVLKFVNALFRSNKVIVEPPSLDVNWNW